MRVSGKLMSASMYKFVSKFQPLDNFNKITTVLRTASYLPMYLKNQSAWKVISACKHCIEDLSQLLKKLSRS